MTNKQPEIITDVIALTAAENLKLSPKKAATFAKQARALQHNLALRKKQKQEREALNQKKQEEAE